jgi:hypothetical protein
MLTILSKIPPLTGVDSTAGKQLSRVVLHLYDDCVGEQAPGLFLFHGLSPCDSVPLTQSIKLTTNKQFYSVTPSNSEKSFSINMQAKFEENDKIWT